VLFVLPEIPDDAPAPFKNGLAIRNAATTSGQCPDCCAHGEIAGPDRHGFMHLTFCHEAGCGVLHDGEAA
jgi:hypothetical protein